MHIVHNVIQSPLKYFYLRVTEKSNEEEEDVRLVHSEIHLKKMNYLKLDEYGRNVSNI